MSHLAALASGVLAAVVAASAIGCGEVSSGVPIAGKVSYHGEPIAHGALMFFPARGRAISAATDAAGDYTVELAPGEYRVIVNTSVSLPRGWKEGDPVPQQEIVLPTEFTIRARTPLKATVPASGGASIDFVLP